MEVAEDTYDTRDLGRVVWSIEYSKSGQKRERYSAEDSKLVSQINIRSKDQQGLVPVLKVSKFDVFENCHSLYPLLMSCPLSGCSKFDVLK